MKKLILSLFVTLVACDNLNAQIDMNDSTDVFNSSFKRIKLRHIKGIHSLEGKYMYANLGPAYELNYGYLITDELFFHLGFYYETGKLNYSNFDYKNGKIGLSYSVFKIKQRLYLNPDVSFMVGKIAASNDDLKMSDDYMNFAAAFGLNAELYVINKVSLIFCVDQQYNFKDKFGKWHYNAGGGLRIYFN